MTPPRSFIGTVTSFSWLAHFRNRVVVFGLLTLICVALAVYPPRYRAAVTLTPTDPQSLGLSGTLGQLGALNNVFGSQAAVEIALRVGQSVYTRDIVLQRLNLGKRLGISDRRSLHRWLEERVNVRSLRGGIVSIEMKDRDANLARDVVGAYAYATQQRLGQISRTQTAYKRDVLRQLVAEASQQLSVAQAAYNQFRLKNRTPAPNVAFDTVSYRILQLESGMKSKEVQLAVARQLYADDNNVIRQIKAELAALQGQLVRLQTSSGDDSVGGVVAQTNEQFKLERELALARSLYDSYLKFLQGTTVEELTSTANMRILEPAYIDTERQFWWPALAAAISLMLLWFAIEFYRLRPPLGARLPAEENNG